MSSDKSLIRNKQVDSKTLPVDNGAKSGIDQDPNRIHQLRVYVDGDPHEPYFSREEDVCDCDNDSYVHPDGSSGLLSEGRGILVTTVEGEGSDCNHYYVVDSLSPDNSSWNDVGVTPSSSVLSVCNCCVNYDENLSQSIELDRFFPNVSDVNSRDYQDYSKIGDIIENIWTAAQETDLYTDGVSDSSIIGTWRCSVAGTITSIFQKGIVLDQYDLKAQVFVNGMYIPYLNQGYTIDISDQDHTTYDKSVTLQDQHAWMIPGGLDVLTFFTWTCEDTVRSVFCTVNAYMDSDIVKESIVISVYASPWGDPPLATNVSGEGLLFTPPAAGTYFFSISYTGESTPGGTTLIANFIMANHLRLEGWYWNFGDGVDSKRTALIQFVRINGPSINGEDPYTSKLLATGDHVSIKFRALSS